MTKRQALAIGPLNTAGQAYQWSEAVGREMKISAWSYAGTRRSSRRFNGHSHYRVPNARIRPRTLRQAWIRHLLATRTHLLVESSMAVLGDPHTTMFTDELTTLRDAGLVVGGISHGSDIRSPAAHMARVEHSFYTLYDGPGRDAVEAATLRRRTALTTADIPCFVSTPDLLFDLPDAVWLPLVVDLDIWATDEPALSRRRPVVLHVPSRRNPPIKGTHIIDPILQELDQLGIIDYVSPSRPMGRATMQTLVRASDIVIDQLLIDSYGVAAVEGMAAGRLVIGHVGTQTRHRMPAEPPILDVKPEDLGSVISNIAHEPGQFRDVARSGPEYVRRIHSGAMSARVLETFLMT